MSSNRSKGQFLSVCDGSAPESFVRTMSLIKNTKEIQCDSVDSFRHAHSHIDFGIMVLVVLVIQSADDIVSALELLGLYGPSIRNGVIRVFVFNHLTDHQGMIELLLAGGCEEVVDNSIQPESFLLKIKEGLFGKYCETDASLFDELGISKDDLLGHDASLVQEISQIFDESVDPVVPFEANFRTIELIVKIETKKRGEVSQWDVAQLIENRGRQISISTLPLAAALDENVSLNISSLGLSLDFDSIFSGVVTNVENLGTEDLLEITLFQGDLEALEALASLYLKRQNEIFEFLSNAKGY